MQLYSNRYQTNSVQTFIRFFIFVVVFAILAIPVLPFFLSLDTADSFPFIPTLYLAFAAFVATIAAKMIYILPEWERMVLLRLGKYAGTKGPGMFVIPPFIYSIARIVDTRIITQQVEATATLTQDNVPTRVTAAIEFEVEDPKKAVVDVQDFLSTVIWLSTEALKNTIGSLDLKELLSNRDEIARQLKEQIDSEAATYGINVRAVRITDIDTPPELIEELAVIARAHRAARAKQIQAEAEVMVAKKVAEASDVLAKNEGAYKLRELQNLAEMSKEESSMIIIYPSDSHAGADLSRASVAVAQQNKKK